jgi:hypothetical protein
MFSLLRMQARVAFGEEEYRITQSARIGAQALYLDEDDIVACIRGLTESDYEQTLSSTAMPGTYQDVYKCRYHGFEIYLKLRLVEDRLVVVISFKQNTSP